MIGKIRSVFSFIANCRVRGRVEMSRLRFLIKIDIRRTGGQSASPKPSSGLPLDTPWEVVPFKFNPLV